MRCNEELWDKSKQWMWKCELEKNHKGNHKATFNWIELDFDEYHPEFRKNKKR